MIHTRALMIVGVALWASCCSGGCGGSWSGRMWYVSDRPDLTTNVGPEDIRYVGDRVDHYFSRIGVPRPASKDLVVATRWDRQSGTLLFRFACSDELGKRFIRGLKPVQAPFRSALETWNEHGNMDYGRLLAVPPYSQLSWWPPAIGSQGAIKTFRGEMTWNVGDVNPGTLYFVFWDQRNRLIYVVGW
jgi:hypothetical protein